MNNKLKSPKSENVVLDDTNEDVVIVVNPEVLERDKKDRIELKRIESEKMELNKRTRQLKAKVKKAAVNVARELRNREIYHVGGMVEMTGLLTYRYEGEQRDNKSDNLCANLIVGVLLEASETLSTAPDEQIKKLWNLGQTFREKEPKDRVLAMTNENYLKIVADLNEEYKSKVDEQSNGNVKAISNEFEESESTLGQHNDNV